MEEVPEHIRAMQAALQAKRSPKQKQGDAVLPNRRDRRGRQQQVNGHPPEPTGRAPRTTGSRTHWVADMKRAKAVQDALRKLPTAGLTQDCPDLRLLARDFPNAWVLSQATVEALLAVRGVGPAKLRKIRAYLSRKNVACKWRVDGNA
jgi:hypothetical protein